jgi:hypothetical protein
MARGRFSAWRECGHCVLLRTESSEDTLKAEKSYRFKPFPKFRERISFARTITEYEFHTLSNAPAPETMDRRWHSVVKSEWLSHPHMDRILRFQIESSDLFAPRRD